MVEWMTLQQTAEKIGLRKGTLCMWRTRNRFPFETKGDGRGLVINSESVETWMAKRKSKPAEAKKTAAKAPVSRKKAAKRGRRRGRPAKTAVTAGRPSKSGCEIVVQGNLDLETIQHFVTQLKAGADLQIAPSKDGYILRTV